MYRVRIEETMPSIASSFALDTGQFADKGRLKYRFQTTFRFVLTRHAAFPCATGAFAGKLFFPIHVACFEAGFHEVIELALYGQVPQAVCLNRPAFIPCAQGDGE